jgi:hypothetical protein
MQAAHAASVNQTRVLELQLFEANQRCAAAVAEVQQLSAICNGLRDDIKTRDAALQAKDEIISQLHAEITRRACEAPPVTMAQLERQLAILRGELCGSFQILLEKAAPKPSAVGSNVAEVSSYPQSANASHVLQLQNPSASQSQNPSATQSQNPASLLPPQASRPSTSIAASQGRQPQHQLQMQHQLQQHFQHQWQQQNQQPHRPQQFQQRDNLLRTLNTDCDPFAPSPMPIRSQCQIIVHSPHASNPQLQLRLVSPAPVTTPEVSILSPPLSSQVHYRFQPPPPPKLQHLFSTFTTPNPSLISANCEPNYLLSCL